jgi:hypothetical protein
MSPPPQNGIFLDRMVCYLMPYFLPMTTSIDLARAEILATLEAYGAHSRPDLLNAVQIIAFSLSALDALTAAKIDTTLAPSMQLRVRNCANALNRSAQQAQKALATRMKCDRPSTAKSIGNPTGLPTEEILRRIDAQVAATRNAAHPQNPDSVFSAIFAETQLTHPGIGGLVPQCSRPSTSRPNPA